MTSPSQAEIENTAQVISNSHITAVPGEHARAAGDAAASLCSGAALRVAPTDLEQLIAEAMQIGYAAALWDVRDGDFDVAFASVQQRPEASGWTARPQVGMPPGLRGHADEHLERKCVGGQPLTGSDLASSAAA